MGNKYVSLQLVVISGVTFSFLDTALNVTLRLCFHLSSHPSETWKSGNSRLFAWFRAFSLTIIQLTIMLFERAFLNEVKTASSTIFTTTFLQLFPSQFHQTGFICFKDFYFIFLQSMWKWYSSLYHISLRNVFCKISSLIISRNLLKNTCDKMCSFRCYFLGFF